MEVPGASEVGQEEEENSALTQKEALRCPDLPHSYVKPLIRARKLLQQFLKSQHNTRWKFPTCLYKVRGKPAEQNCIFSTGVFSISGAAATEALPPEFLTQQKVKESIMKSG